MVITNILKRRGKSLNNIEKLLQFSYYWEQFKDLDFMTLYELIKSS